MPGYAIISVGGKQYRVREGERLLVDRVAVDEGKTFTPAPLLVGGDGEPSLDPKGVTVKARVIGHVLGKKVRIGKYRPKTGYRRHTGFRARLSQIEIESIGTKPASRAKADRAGAEEQPKPARKTTTPKKAE
jgi:large subunit ribosomal protein L21